MKGVTVALSKTWFAPAFFASSTIAGMKAFVNTTTGMCFSVGASRPD